MRTIITACARSGHMTGFNGSIPWLTLPEWVNFILSSVARSGKPVAIVGTEKESEIYKYHLGESPPLEAYDDNVCIVGSNEEVLSDSLSFTKEIFIARIDMLLTDGPVFPGIPEDVFQKVSYSCTREEMPVPNDRELPKRGFQKATIVPVTFEHWIRRNKRKKILQKN